MEEEILSSETEKQSGLPGRLSTIRSITGRVKNQPIRQYLQCWNGDIKHTRSGEESQRVGGLSNLPDYRCELGEGDQECRTGETERGRQQSEQTDSCDKNSLTIVFISVCLFFK